MDRGVVLLLYHKLSALPPPVPALAAGWGRMSHPLYSHRQLGLIRYLHVFCYEDGRHSDFAGRMGCGNVTGAWRQGWTLTHFKNKASVVILYASVAFEVMLRWSWAEAAACERCQAPAIDFLQYFPPLATLNSSCASALIGLQATRRSSCQQLCVGDVPSCLNVCSKCPAETLEPYLQPWLPQEVFPLFFRWVFSLLVMDDFCLLVEI